MKQPSKGGVAEEDLFEVDETAPMVNSDPSEYYNSNTQVPVSGFTEYLQNRKREDPDWYKQEFSVSKNWYSLIVTTAFKKQLVS